MGLSGGFSSLDLIRKKGFFLFFEEPFFIPVLFNAAVDVVAFEVRDHGSNLLGRHSGFFFPIILGFWVKYNN